MPFTTFPLHGILAGAAGPRCACSDPSCTRTGKHPAWRYSELQPGEQVPPRPGQGTALLTGIKSGVFVVDTDGEEADARFRAMGPLPETWTVSTPSGGRHYYFEHPGWPIITGAHVLGDKIDVRGDVNGFVCLPGTQHKSGRAYVVDDPDADIAAAPDWLLNDPRIRGKSLVSDASENAPIPIDVTTEEGQRRVATATELCRTWPVVPGDGGTSFFALCTELVRTLELPLETCHALLAEVHNLVTMAEGTKPWTDAEIVHKLTCARDDSTKPCGPIPEGFGEALSALAGKPQKGKATTLREHDPNHRYKVDLGDTPNGKGHKASPAAVVNLLECHEDWEGVLRYDEFRDRVLAVDPPTKMRGAESTGLEDGDVFRVMHWFEVAGQLLVGRETAQSAIEGVARKHAFHPVREWLASLPPGDPSLLDTAAAGCFGPTVTPLDCVYLKRFLVGAVRRILKPGTKLDTMLVLAGAQGVGKSTFVRALFGEEWTSEDLADLSSVDAVIGLQGRWAVEVAELDKIIRTDPETAKAFLSKTTDDFRPKYGRNNVVRSRQCVFIGTTNRDDILRDASGSRRFWVTDVKRVDLEWVRQNRDALFAAALALEATGEQHWLTQEEEAQRDVAAVQWQEEDPWAPPIAEFLVGRETVTLADVNRVVGGALGDLDWKTTNRLANILHRLGCKRRVTRDGIKRARVWAVPEELAKIRTKIN